VELYLAQYVGIKQFILYQINIAVYQNFKENVVGVPGLMARHVPVYQQHVEITQLLPVHLLAVLKAYAVELSAARKVKNVNQYHVMVLIVPPDVFLLPAHLPDVLKAYAVVLSAAKKVKNVNQYHVMVLIVHTLNVFLFPALHPQVLEVVMHKS